MYFAFIVLSNGACSLALIAINYVIERTYLHVWFAHALGTFFAWHCGLVAANVLIYFFTSKTLFTFFIVREKKYYIYTMK